MFPVDFRRLHWISAGFRTRFRQLFDIPSCFLGAIALLEAFENFYLLSRCPNDLVRQLRQRVRDSESAVFRATSALSSCFRAVYELSSPKDVVRCMGLRWIRVARTRWAGCLKANGWQVTRNSWQLLLEGHERISDIVDILLEEAIYRLLEHEIVQR